jgi:N-acetylglucosaminyldiphosphoundecaprenol N-acetyl-beta-D-mannosaminyltransferase
MNTTMISLLPRAKLRDVLGGRARLVGSRFDSAQPRGLLSPMEPRLRMGIPYGDLRVAEADYLARRSLRADLGVLLRTAVAYALSPSGVATPQRRPFIVSATVDNLSIDEAMDVILSAPKTDRAKLVFFVHAHALNVARFRRDYAGVLAQADALLPDGIGIRMAARFLGVAMRHNVNGTDLFPFLCREAARMNIPVAMIGGAPGVAEACARRMQADTPALKVPLVSSGFFATEQEARAMADRVAALGRVLVLVGMGSPRQEQWSARYLRSCAGATVLTVGGLFDFYSGRMPRAPITWREAGLEWAYRFLQEPRRLAKRYLVGNPLFLALAAEQRLRGRKT